MRIKLTFGATSTPFTEPTQNYVNGVIHTILGKGNSYHDTFSNYSVSMLRGGKYTDKGLVYPNGGEVYVSSPDMEFIDTFLINLIHQQGLMLRDMKLLSYEVSEIKVHSDYDIIHTLSPILLKKDNRRITFKDDGFIERLNEQSMAKLVKNGLTEADLKGFVIKPFHFENGQVKLPKVNNVVNPSSKVMLVVEGTPIARKTIYEMGLGNSTGCGFGAVKVRIKKKNLQNIWKFEKLVLSLQYENIK